MILIQIRHISQHSVVRLVRWLPKEESTAIIMP